MANEKTKFDGFDAPGFPEAFNTTPDPAEMAELEKSLNEVVGSGSEETQIPEITESPKEDAALQQEESPKTVETTPVAEEPKEVQAEAQVKPEEKIEEDDIDQIKPSKGTNPKSPHWAALRGKAKEYKTKWEAESQEKSEIKKLAEEQQRVIANLSSQPAPPEVAKELEDLRKFRRMHDLKSDPKFVENFDNKIKSLADEAFKILEEQGLPETYLNKIKQEGFGGETFNNAAKSVFEALDFKTSRKLENNLREIDDLSKNKEVELEKSVKEREEWYSKQTQAQEAEEQAEQTLIEGHLAEVLKAYPDARIQEIPLNATPQEKARIESANKFYQESEQRFELALRPPNVETKVQTAFAAVMAFKLADRIDNVLEPEIKRLREENLKLKSAGQTSKIKSVSSGSDSKPHEKDLSKMTDYDAVNATLESMGI